VSTEISTQQSSRIERFAGLPEDELIRAFRIMHTSRRLDDREVTLKRQNRIYFQISGAGHEAVQVAAGMALRSGHDWVYPYYRDRALCLTLGVTPHEMLQQAVGAAADPASGGRQMPSHWGHRKYHVVSSSSPTGTQFLQAVGCAEASRYKDPKSDEVTLVCAGDGATSEGEFWEALNVASLALLPVLFLIEDNGYAISVPIEAQTAGGSISALTASFPGLFRQDVDGTDFFASYRAMRDAAQYCREGRGPALVHARVIRPYSHSLSDDERVYRTAAEREAESARDPVILFPKLLIEEGVMDRRMLQNITHEIDEEVQQATQEAMRDDPPAPASALTHLYSDTVDATSQSFAVKPQFLGAPMTMVDSINAALREEMRRNPDILVFGEDVADCTREASLSEVKGKGGVFKVTWGLQREFGGARVYNTPLAEANIVGRAIGLAIRGFKPVVEIQFFDYIWPAYMQIRDELATMRWRSSNAFAAPVVIRVTYGGYIRGALYHSQTGASIFTHCPGLRVICPSTALDANGLLRTAIRCEDPVLVLEHKHLYRQTYNKAVYPGPDFMIPFGKARIARPGSDLTIVTYGATVQRAVTAANQLQDERGIDAEVIDLRSLSPWDEARVYESVKRTNRVIVAYEDAISWGYGAEIAARIADDCFAWLDAPVKRVASTDTFVGYAPQLEDAILPQVGDFKRAITELMAF